MDINDIYPLFKRLFGQITGIKADSVTRLPLSGSNRLYYRITGGDRSLIGTYNTDVDENKAFLHLAGHFKKHRVPVPKIYYSDLNSGIYVQEDIGDECLFDLATNPGLSQQEKIDAYKKVIALMPALQYESASDLDFSVCYPRESFDRQSIQWDLNYFKYLYLKLAYVPFHEQLLEDEFSRLIDFLLEAPSSFFLFRDFKSKNIMWKDNEPYFIDFQGGRRGALPYDLASLLFEAKAGLSPDMREILLNYYIEVFEPYDFFDKGEFLKYYPAFVLIRQLQAFGAYGYRGIFEKKAYFVQSIRHATDNLDWISGQDIISGKFPYLCHILDMIKTNKSTLDLPDLENGLTVTITSFSYRNGIPEDWSGNGGGFVFDCRSFHNPGRYEDLKLFTGRDTEIIEFLVKEGEAEIFLNSVKEILQRVVTKYQKRKFRHLSVSFGCTGGRHRSVYSAEQIFHYLKMNFDVSLRLIHRELNIREYYDKDDVQEK
jgi:aminoglycoside/choline kinase family phosphotransferase